MRDPRLQRRMDFRDGRIDYIREAFSVLDR